MKIVACAVAGWCRIAWPLCALEKPLVIMRKRRKPVHNWPLLWRDHNSGPSSDLLYSRVLYRTANLPLLLPCYLFSIPLLYFLWLSTLSFFFPCVVYTSPMIFLLLLYLYAVPPLHLPLYTLPLFSPFGSFLCSCSLSASLYPVVVFQYFHANRGTVPSMRIMYDLVYPVLVATTNPVCHFYFTKLLGWYFLYSDLSQCLLLNRLGASDG